MRTTYPDACVGVVDLQALAGEKYEAERNIFHNKPPAMRVRDKCL